MKCDKHQLIQCFSISDVLLREEILVETLLGFLDDYPSVDLKLASGRADGMPKFSWCQYKHCSTKS